MTDPRQRRLEFLDRFDSSVVVSINENAAQFAGYAKLLESYRRACQAWREADGRDFRTVTEWANEICIADRLLRQSDGRRVEYEPTIPGTRKTIDFLFHTIDGRRLYYDVKTVHPDDKDALESYNRAREHGWFGARNDLVLAATPMAGSVAHWEFVSRAKFLHHALDLEAKMKHLPADNVVVRMVFCGNGQHWTGAELEDFADSYFNGRHRDDDPLGAMEKYYLEERGRTLSRTIHGFCQFQRRALDLEPNVVRCDVRGPEDCA